MAVKEEIEAITKEAKEMFCKRTERLFLERVKADKMLADQYAGREIYELLQNIDDAYDPSCQRPCTASIVLSEDSNVVGSGYWLEVSNYGRPFTLETLQRLCQGNVSAKGNAYIGCKGIGFRSVLNWSDEIEIYSGADESYYSVGFSREYAAAQYEEIKTDPHINNQAEELQQGGYLVVFPMFKAPKYIQPIEKVYDTVIRIKIRDDRIRGKIVGGIKDFNRHVMLFMPHIQTIEFRLGDETWTYTRTLVEDNKIEIVSTSSDGIDRRESFVFAEEEELSDPNNLQSKKIKRAVAVPVEENKDTYPLYSFFPLLNEKSPFKALLHATFCLRPNRNSLDMDSEEARKTNERVYKGLLDLYVKTVAENIMGERRLQLLKPITFTENIYWTFEFAGQLEQFRLGDWYIDSCRKQKIFWALNETYLSVADKPIVLRNVPAEFTKEAFPTVVPLSDDKDVERFAMYLIGTNVQFEDAILNAINKVSQDWNHVQRAAVFKWWVTQGFSRLPKLLKKTTGDFITTSSEPCFLSGSIQGIPDWAQISVLAEADENELLSVFDPEIQVERRKKEESPKRILPRLITRRQPDLINLQEQSSRAALISPVNASVQNNYNHSVEFLKWLWAIWREDRFDEKIRETIFRLPAADGTSVCESRFMYLGRDYGNELGDDFFKSDTRYKPLQKVDLQECPKSAEVEDFFLALGVLKFPKVLLLEFNKDECTQRGNKVCEYIEWLKKSHPLDCRVNYYRAKLWSVKEIEKILKENETTTILKWIFSDGELNGALCGDYEKGQAAIFYRPRVQGQKYDVQYNSGWLLPSYLKYVFSTAKWLQVGNEKYAPQELVVSGDRVPDWLGVACITEKEVDELAQAVNVGHEVLKKLLVAIGVKESFLAIGSSQFYTLLLNLPGADREIGGAWSSSKFSRALYRSIIENNVDGEKKWTEFYADSDEKKKFFKEGKVLAKNSTGISYQPVSSVWFSSSATFNLNDEYMIDVPSRSGRRDDFNEILNVRPFEMEYSVEPIHVSNSQSEFERDFKDFMQCAMTYRAGKKTELNGMEIKLVDQVVVSIGQTKRTEFAPYTLLKVTKKSWAVYIPSVSSYSNLEKDLLAEAIVQAFNVVLNFPSREFLSKIEQLFVYTPKQRKRLIRSDFGSLEEYEATKDEVAKDVELRNGIKEKIRGDNPTANLTAINDLIDKIDWLDTSSLGGQEQICELLKALGKDVAYLADILGRGVSVAKYNRSRLRKCYELGKDSFKLRVYKALANDNDRHPQLIGICNALGRKVEDFEIPECAKFDVTGAIGELEDQCFKENEIPNDGFDVEITMEGLRRRYEEGIRKLQSLLVGTEISVNDFTNNPECDSLLYFGDEDEERVKTDVKNLVDGLKNNSDEVSAGREEQERLLQMCSNAEVVDTLIPRQGHLGNGGSRRGNPSAVTIRDAVKRNRVNKRQGDLAEYAVILKLVAGGFSQVNSFFGNDANEKGDYAIYWHSGAAKDIEMLIPRDADNNLGYDISETDDGLGYDIELRAKDGSKKMFIEVKSSSDTRCTFIMSSNEYNKARELNTDCNAYRIVFVSGMAVTDENCNPQIAFIDKDLDECFDRTPTAYEMRYKNVEIMK